MIGVAEMRVESGPNVSVAEATVTARDEVKMMSATTMYRTAERRVRPSGLDRLVMRVSLSMLLWARRHADQSALLRDEQQRRYQVRREVERREHAALQLTRVF
jgi:hypothetical protein